jgi:broad specificity phosphatase PhoE
VRVYLVRHGRATAGWDVDPDPGLDELGHAQAVAAADRLEPFGPLPIVTSPLRRTRETAMPLAQRWHLDPVVDSAVAEIPSPEGIAMGERVDWLRTAMNGSWSALGPRYTGFRDAVADRIRAMSEHSVVVSHFIAINAVIGACLNDDRVVIASLDNCSITVVDVDPDGSLRLVEQGHQADTLIR